ncbi:MAG: 50S ribosomal protein L25 [Chloroflexi bacterium]|nr:50S ribosomal protein L25 [Chloroflexota bacterium]
MDVQSVKLSPRSVIGKKVKQLRRQGVVPVHMYGVGIESQPLQVEAGVLRRLLPQVGTNVPVSIEIDGGDGENICFVREVQRHPVTEAILHVDFIRVDVSQTIRAEVPLVLIGNAPAVRQGGTLLQPLQRLLVEALPMNMPESLEVDVADLDDFEKAVYVSSIEVDSNVTVITESEEMIARVIPPRVEVEEEVVGEELEEGEEAAEDAEAAAGESSEA